jgi:hypothetical protein
VLATSVMADGRCVAGCPRSAKLDRNFLLCPCPVRVGRAEMRVSSMCWRPRSSGRGRVAVPVCVRGMDWILAAVCVPSALAGRRFRQRPVNGGAFRKGPVKIGVPGRGPVGVDRFCKGRVKVARPVNLRSTLSPATRLSTRFYDIKQQADYTTRGAACPHSADRMRDLYLWRVTPPSI